MGRTLARGVGPPESGDHGHHGRARFQAAHTVRSIRAGAVHPRTESRPARTPASARRANGSATLAIATGEPLSDADLEPIVDEGRALLDFVADDAGDGTVEVTSEA